MRESYPTRGRSRASSRREQKLIRQLKLIHRHANTDGEANAQKPEIDPNDFQALEQFHDLYDLAPIGFYTLDRQAKICELNEKGAKLLGFPDKWLIGKPFVVFIARQDIQRFLDLLRESIKNPEPRTIEVDMYVGDDRTLPVQISLTTASDGPTILHRITVVDLTDFRKTEKLLQESVSNWYSLVHNAPDTIMTVNANGRINFVNRPVWGYSSKALVGTNILDYVPEDAHPQVFRCLDQAFRFNRRMICEISGAGGAWDSWFSFSFGSPHPSAAFAGGASTTATTTVVIREISEQKRTEEALRTSGEQLRDFAARLETVREEERTQLAREIHDDLGQALTALKLDLSWLHNKTRGAAETRARMKTMIEHVDDTIERVRKIASELRPPILDDLGLIPAIEWQVSQFRKRTRIRTELLSNVDGLSLPTEASVAVFRVVQEALTNVMRHAKASKLRISLDLLGHTFRIRIQDNGRGITPTEKDDLKSLGIVGMRERISRLSGELKIFSEPGKGTRLDIVIPAPND